MTNEQERNCLDWVEAMLSGQYKHGKVLLYNASLDTHSVHGVALRLAKHPVVWGNQFAEVYPVQRNRFVSSLWFEKRFGLKHLPSHYQTVNDMTSNYLAVCALVLNACSQTGKQRMLHNKMMQQFRSSHSRF